MALNAIGREIPERVGNFKLTPYQGVFTTAPGEISLGKKQARILPGESKLKDSIKDAIIATGLKDGMTISFHHHFRDGDKVILMVLEEIKKLNIKNLVLAPSSLTDVHDPVIDYIKAGVIRRIETSGLRGELGKAISHGILEEPVIFRTHGGRVRALETGELHIDVAFLGMPACDEYGNANGFSGKNICGSLGYALADAESAEKVVMITDNLCDYPCVPASIEQSQVDYVVVVKEIGDSALIGKGAARVTRDPQQLLIAKSAANVIEASGYFNDGFSMQTGVGAVTIAVTNFLKEKMIAKNIKASFILGGIGGANTQLHEEGLAKAIFAVQSYDLVASKAVGENLTHYETGAGLYANPHNKGCIVNKLDIVVLSALEIDTNFNVNILTGFNGEIRGALGGGPDSAAGAKLSIFATPLIRGRIPTIAESINTVCNPGETVDVVVTDYGVAVNPTRQDLLERLSKEKIKLVTIEELRKKAEQLTGKGKPIAYTDKVVAIVEYRDGTIIDVIRQVKDEE
jgi:citrate lyase subunit alpha/citrate CoA-transferase